MTKVLANLARKPGELRDMAAGPYPLSVLIRIVGKWDNIEEKSAGLSGINADYTMLGLLGIPTFFIALLNEITMMKEEQVALLRVDADDLDEAGLQTRRTLISKHSQKIRDLVWPHLPLPSFNGLAEFHSRNVKFNSQDPDVSCCLP